MVPSSIENYKQLANFLRCDETFLVSYLQGDVLIHDRKDQNPLPDKIVQNSIIEILYLKKKSKRRTGYRRIFSIRTDTLKNTLKLLNTFLRDSFTPAEAIHGYIKGRNIRTNAEAHLAKEKILSVDIANFFETITAEMVAKALEKIGFSPFAAHNISILVTIGGVLVPGFNTSPTLSNIIMADTDEQLLTLCGSNVTYTRYADDLYFSSREKLPSLHDIEKVLKKSGFTLNPLKTKYMPRGSRQYVTGLTVFDNIRPRVTKEIKRNLRLELYFLQKFGLRNHILQRLHVTSEEYDLNKEKSSEVDAEVHLTHLKLEGWIRFMKSVERPAAVRFEKIYEKVRL